MKKVDENEVSDSRYELLSLFKGNLLSYLVGIYIFAFYLELQLRISFLQSFRFQFVFGLLIGILSLLKLSKSGYSGGLNSVTKTVIGLILILGFYTIFSMDRDESIRVYIDRVLKFALVSFFMYAAVDKIEDLRVVVAFIFLAWLKMGQEGFLGWYTGSLIWENQGIPRLHGSTAMYGHPNSFSGFGVSCLPFCAFLLMSVKSNLIKLFITAIFLCSLLIILTTGSRAGYVAVVIGSLFFFWQLKLNKVKILFAILIITIGGISFIPDEYKGRFDSIFTGEAKEGHSSDKRKEIIEDAFKLYAKYPFGIGVQAFPAVRDQMFGRKQNTHNLYLEVLTNIGPIGFVVFCIFIVKMINLNRTNIKWLRQNNTFKDIDNLLLINLSKAVIGYIFLRLILGLFGMDLYEIYWWIALGFTLGITKLINLKKPKPHF